MKTMLNSLLEALRERVNQNIATIRINEQEIRNILNEPLSNQRTHNLNNRYELSKKILAENRENLEMQKLLVAFKSKLKDIPEYNKDMHSLNNFENEVRSENQENKLGSNTKLPKNINENKQKQENIEETKSEDAKVMFKTITLSNEQVADSIFRLTIEGKLAFNKAHPRFNDNDFYNDLLNYHIAREEYEICNQLVKSRK